MIMNILVDRNMPDGSGYALLTGLFPAQEVLQPQLAEQEEE